MPLSPHEAPIKIVHMWASMFAVMLTIGASAIGVVWSIATFKSDTSSDVKAIRLSVDELAKGFQRVADQSRENHEYILEHKSDIDALREPRSRPVPRFEGRSIK